jgi:hypothetical protein
MNVEERLLFLESELARLRNGNGHYGLRKQYSAKEFKETFKIGDEITGWATGKSIKIIAIGNERFLWIDQFSGHEGVSKMTANKWAKTEEIRKIKKLAKETK